jgi:hypothetical protein
VVKLADARDSKSRGVHSPCGFDSHLRHQPSLALISGEACPPCRSESEPQTHTHLVHLIRIPAVQCGGHAAGEDLLVPVSHIEADRSALKDDAAAGAEQRFGAVEEREARVDDRAEGGVETDTVVLSRAKPAVASP